MKIAICDDSVIDTEFLSVLLKKYGLENNFDYKIDLFTCGMDLLNAMVHSDYSIIFLDIYMRDLDGIEVAKQIREFSSCAIIFTTTSLDHAIASYSINATHYLVKPLSYSGICEALDRCKKLLISAQKYIIVRIERMDVKFYLSNILYIEVCNKTTTLYVTSHKVDIPNTPLEAIWTQLKDSTFLRCHRSYIVNMDYILDMTSNSFILKDGTSIPIRQSGLQTIKKDYLAYKLEQARAKNYF